MARIKVLLFTNLPLQQPLFEQECEAESFQHILDYVEDYGFIDVIDPTTGKRSRFYKANIGIITHNHPTAIVVSAPGIILPGAKLQ